MNMINNEQLGKRASIEPFKFDKQGRFLAVYYDDKFYVREAIGMISPEKATVTYIENCNIQKNIF